MYVSTKRYGHERGLSCAFRQWRAESHCNLIHGYSVSFEFTFEAHQLDERGWVVDFGSLKSLKGWLERMFDHTTLVAEDDPHLDRFRELNDLHVIDMRVLPGVGCERMAEYVWEYADQWLADNGYAPRVHLRSVQVWEHEGNSARCERPRRAEFAKLDVGNAKIRAQRELEERIRRVADWYRD